LERLEKQLHGEATWDGRPDHDRLEYVLMAGYVIIAILAVMAGGRTRIGVDLSKVVPDPLPAASRAFLPSIFDLMSTSTDIIAAVGLLMVAIIMLYRRRTIKRPEPAPEATPGRFDLPFLF
jgi:hypothetical protein